MNPQRLCAHKLERRNLSGGEVRHLTMLRRFTRKCKLPLSRCEFQPPLYSQRRRLMDRLKAESQSMPTNRTGETDMGKMGPPAGIAALASASRSGKEALNAKDCPWL